MPPLLPALLLAGCAAEPDTAAPFEAGAEGPGCGGTEVDVYSPGMEVDGRAGAVLFALERAAPEPPDVGENTWTVLLSAGGAPLEGARLTLEPLMPDHGHGTSPASFDGRELGQGRYEVGPFDLSMPGVWDFPLTARGATSDEAGFTFCVEG